MKFLVDNQLPTAVARWISANGGDAMHVLDLGLAQEDDRSLWDIPAGQGRVVVSKDEDFFFLATRPGDVGRLLWVRVGNCRKQHLLQLLQRHWEEILEVFGGGQRIVELR